MATGHIVLLLCHRFFSASDQNLELTKTREMPRTFITPTGKNLCHVRSLGRGQFGVADLVKDRKNDNYCLKQVPVRTSDEDAKTDVMKEVDLMKASVHPNVVVLYDSWFDRNRLYILMEFCANASVDLLITEYTNKSLSFTEDKVVSFLTELSSALVYLHDTLRIMHRDLKPANIFMDRIGTLKIGDFGLSKCLGGDDLCATMCGSPLYMSPEQCRGDSYSFRTDVWALGCIAYEFMTLRSPWLEQEMRNYAALVYSITNHKPRFDRIELRYSDTLVNSTRWMLRKTPAQRWTAAKVNQNLRPQTIQPPLDASVRHMRRVSPSPITVDDEEDASPTADPPTPFLPPARPPTPIGPLEALKRQEALVQDAAKLAALIIQKSFRVSTARREHTPPLPLVQTPKVLVPMDKTRETTSPKEKKAAITIQTVLRASLNRRRFPRTPRANPTPVAPPNQCSARITQLALPRRPSVRKLPPSVLPKVVVTPRAAW